jgi:hypothetical protein
VVAAHEVGEKVELLRGQRQHFSLERVGYDLLGGTVDERHVRGAEQVLPGTEQGRMIGCCPNQNGE